MKLIGNYLSPYVRRVAVTLNLLDMPFEQEAVFVFKEPDRVRPHNPVTRIPVLVLDDGEELIESAAILDAVDDMAGPERALTPRSGPERRKVMKATAVAIGAAEKMQATYYEMVHRPEEKRHAPWLERNEGQALAGFAWLDDLAGKAGENGWLAGTGRIGQADVSTACVFGFAKAIRPELGLAERFPALEGFAGRCEALDAFRRAPIPTPG